MNYEDIKDKIAKVSVQSLTSKGGYAYTVIIYHFTNGYQHRNFLNNEQIFAIRDAAGDQSSKFFEDLN